MVGEAQIERHAVTSGRFAAAQTRVIHWHDRERYWPEERAYIGRRVQWATPREPASTFANPYPVEQHGRQGAISLYRLYLTVMLQKVPGRREELERLRGRVLGCWCAPPGGEPLTWDRPREQICHGQVIAELLDTGRRA